MSRRGVISAGLQAAGALSLAPLASNAAWGALQRFDVGVPGDNGVPSAPILFCPPGLLPQAVGMLVKTPSLEVNSVFGRLLDRHGKTAAELSQHYRQEKPALGFAERSMLLDLTVGSVLAERVAAGKGDAALAKTAEEMSAATVAAVMDLVAALDKVGVKTRDYHVGQGSNMLPLATAYDWLYRHFTADQRKAVVRAMVVYNFVPTLEAMFIGGPEAPKPFWVKGYNNWTTICLGGALGLGLALRKEDDPGLVAAMKLGGATVSRTVAEHMAEFLPVALKNLRRGFLVIRNNNGLQPEGTGYHHDTVLPLFGMVASIEGAYPDVATRPDFVTEFLADAKQTAAVHIFAGIHMGGPSGADWQYSDGTWPLTSLPINLLIAEYARQENAPLAAAAVWRGLELGGNGDCALHLLYRAFHEPQAAFEPATIPTAHYFFGRLVDPAKGEVAINEFVVTWRQRFGEPQAAAVFFKGGDRRSDYHSHMDIGTFLYDALGVRWAIDVGNAGGYPYYFRDGIKQWEAVTTYQAYPKRAAAHNTLVINPAVNDYTVRGVVKNEWVWQFNPDQALGQDGTSVPVCPVEGLETDPKAGVYRGAVNLAGAYQRHGISSATGGAPADPRRHFQFDLATGVLTIRDELYFKAAHGNDVHWFMNVPMTAVIVAKSAGRVVLGDKRADGTAVYLVVTAEKAVGGNGTGFVVGSPEQTMPPGQPASDILWGYNNAKGHREKVRKIALRMQEVDDKAEIVVSLKPLPEFTGKTAEQVMAGLK